MAVDFGSGAIGAWSSLAHGYIGPSMDAADVLIVGDSITTLGREELTAAVQAENKTLAVAYWSGRPTTPAVDYVLSATVLPPILVMACGANDVYTPTVMEAQIHRLLDVTLPGVEHLLWVDVQVCRPAYALADQRNSGYINAQIRNVLDSNHVVPWSEWFAKDPNRIATYLDSGGVHPINGIGTNFWAEVIMKKLRPLFDPTTQIPPNN